MKIKIKKIEKVKGTASPEGKNKECNPSITIKKRKRDKQSL